MKRNEEAVELLADILEPAIEIFTDEEIVKSFDKDNAMKSIKIVLKKHPKEIVQILAAIDGIDYKKADYTAMDIIKKCLALVNDKDLMDFFTSQLPTA